MVFDLVYVPLRTGVFLVLVAVGFGLDFNLGGLPPATLVVLFFIPFVWGLGLISAAGTLTSPRRVGRRRLRRLRS